MQVSIICFNYDKLTSPENGQNLLDRQFKKNNNNNVNLQ